jgi:hypothetical protein
VPHRRSTPPVDSDDRPYGGLVLSQQEVLAKRLDLASDMVELVLVDRAALPRPIRAALDTALKALGEALSGIEGPSA